MEAHGVERQVGEQPDRLAAVAASASGLVTEEDSDFGLSIDGVESPQPDVADVRTGIRGFDAEIPAIRSLLQPVKPAQVLVGFDTRSAPEQPHHRRVVHPLKRGIQMLLGERYQPYALVHVAFLGEQGHTRNDPWYTEIHSTSTP